MRKVLFALLCVPALAGLARAQTVSQACQPDIASFCPKEQPGPTRFRCLEAHKDKLSAPCQQRLSTMRSEGAAFRADCKADIGASCLGLQRRALLECLESRGDKLSKPCAERVAKMRAFRHARHERIAAACKDDAEKTCAGVGAGGVGACLKAHLSKLSAACRDAMQPHREPSK